MLAFQAQVVYVDGTWRFEVASFPSPHLVMTRVELFLSPDMISLTMSGLILLGQRTAGLPKQCLREELGGEGWVRTFKVGCGDPSRRKESSTETRKQDTCLDQRVL